MNSSSLKPSLTSKIAAGLAYIMPVCLTIPRFINDIAGRHIIRNLGTDAYLQFENILEISGGVIWFIISIITLFFLVKFKDENRKYWIYHFIRSLSFFPFLWINVLIARSFPQLYVYLDICVYLDIILWVIAIISYRIALRGERKTVLSYIFHNNKSTKYVGNHTDHLNKNSSARDKLLSQMKHKQQ